MYCGWLSVLAGIALWSRLEPLPSIVARFEVRWQGQAAANAAGVAFLLASWVVYDKLRARYAHPADGKFSSKEEKPSPTEDPPQ